MAGRFVHAPHVRSAVHADRTVLLDLRRGRYHSLDEVGTRVWALLGEGADTAEIVARLADEFDAPAERITTDVQLFLDWLAADLRVIVPAPLPEPPAEPSTLRCTFTLVAAVLALRMVGLRRSLALARWWAHRRPEAAAPSPELLAGVVRKVATAGAFFPGRARCLEQSLALYVCLRRSGVPAELRIGAQPYPFAAHAWVESCGELVGTSSDQVKSFIPFDHLLEDA